MTKKRKRNNQPADGGEGYNRHSRPAVIDHDDDDRVGFGGSIGRVDPSTGLRSAFPGLDDYGDGETELFYGPAGDGMEYLRMVRSEAKGVPDLLVAPTETEEEVDAAIYDSGRGDGRGYYADGTYVAVADAVPSSATAESARTREPQAVFHESLLLRYRLLRANLRIPPSAPSLAALDATHPTHLPANSKAGFTRFRYLLRTTDPLPAQVAAMDQATVLKLLKMLTAGFLKRRRDVEARTSRWLWALLGRLEEAGCLGGDEVSAVRELGKRAVWLVVGLREDATAEAIAAVAVEDEGEEDAEPDEVSPQDLEEGEVDIEAAKTRLLGRLSADAPPASQEEGEVDEAQTFPSDATRATLDMVITIVGEAYGQRDLLEFREVWAIDGVLLRAAKPLPHARRSLAYLQSRDIPFILLTNGGGKHEAERVAELAERLDVPLDEGLFVQSHTPFAALADQSRGTLRDKCVLVVGGDGDSCRQVAERYGFSNVVTPADIITACPALWPFTRALRPHYASFARPLPAPIDPSSPSTSLKIDAIFVYNDPRDWALDIQLILDLLLSSRGILGTTSSKPGFQTDGQPPLYYSNPDLWWAAAYHLARLGQGGFREALEGVWTAATAGAPLRKTVIGKPYAATYAFAEDRLQKHRRRLLGPDAGALKRVYMVGDNPESDIRGANEFSGAKGTEWTSILVETGVFRGGTPAHKPGATVDDVWDAVRWGVRDSGWATA
ncbi:MAG: hypothetical protein M1832_004597 [Thelocarpon impressellum]|nr:MAG: hypothetical protein M1832_004597 [Thelocarpon impressellum]